MANGGGVPAVGVGAPNSLVDTVAAAVAAGSNGIDPGLSEDHRRVVGWVMDLLDPSRREAALMELSKKREQVPDLALIIWHSFGTLR